ncbi:MAG TPA: glucose-6-phosphate dehydrogenase assembly protein OpcA [Solirubrobacteraceae bacterium]|jgi:glucose-6-phosphate dehydrogenase assembly protein OpcA|nr:glucose-6-phosphate dehydrogenase assembly protein OpcA [Solirubrobacteraceae bacterium]
MPAVSDAVWSEQGTTPDRIEAALRGLLAERHAENGGFVPARALNMIAFVDREWSGEIANRLRGVGRFHASRLVVLSYEPGRERLDARATVASEGDPRPGELSLLRETVVVELGDRHLDDLATIADPLVVTDLPTLLWSPHGHHEIIDALLGLAQAVLLDSVDEPDFRAAIERARELSKRAYVVDLAWLRSTPWRERIATTFDPPARRRELRAIADVAIRHHPESAIAAMLLVGWLASRLGWEVQPLHAREHSLVGEARAESCGEADADDTNAGGAEGADQPIALRLEAAPELQVRGLAGLALETAAGRTLRLDRGPGGLHAYSRDARGSEREWTILGASRGEAGILGEGIRQALLRDPTYGPALAAAAELAP